MNPIPWRRINNWICIACGDCCKKYKVPLTAYEVAKISKIFGYKCLEPSLGCYYLKRKPDGSCIFQISNICGIQNIKPHACKLWPFMIYERAKYGYKNEAEYEYKGRTFYVYVNPYCKGITYGRPSLTFEMFVISEFIELSLESREEQVFSTSTLIRSTLVNGIHKKIPSTFNYYFKNIIF
ncbi:MAG: YkgJ family cysteine cluster protein [Candidatus Methanomethyliaceae archaeon]|nr:YkgJ family cysteine cluster protein [Candidatus Methanomethyliaceae archaeon]MDW7971335.1 YkgJ family cysteine cluster protein [Nitrososphaerota archaeon]